MINVEVIVSMAYLRLNISNLCNFSCKYCHVFKIVDNKLPPKLMDFNTIKFSVENFIRILKRYNEASLTLSIYGGEPLINKHNLFKAIEEYGNSYNGVSITWWVNTNGSLLTEDVADLFKKYDIDVHISVDGFKETHNKNRIDKFGKGTFDRVENALCLITQKNIRVQLNSFVSPDNINNLSELVDLAKQYNIRRVYLDFFYDTQNRMIHPSLLSKKYFEVYVYGLKNNVQISGPWSNVFLKYTNKMLSFNHKTPLINVTVDGKFFFNCNPLVDAFDSDMLNYDQFISNYNMVAQKFSELVSKSCRYCFLRKSCSGAMITQFQYHTRLDKGWGPYCESTRQIIKLIKNKIK